MGILVDNIHFILLVLQREVFTHFADIMGHDKAAECVTFPIRDIKLPWTVNDDSLDCGIYMAYFMEQYQGTLNIDPLHEVSLH